MRTKIDVLKFSQFVLRGSYFRVLVVGRENRKNLDLVKISRFTVCWGEQENMRLLSYAEK